MLRLLDADRPAPPGGHVRYLAQVVDAPAVPLEPAAVDLAPHPLRQPWAEAGGPARSVAWATGELRRLGRRVAAVAQQRTWNLSAIWRLDTDQGPAWLKQLPPFARHEPTVLTFPVDQGVGVGVDLPGDPNSLINGPVVLAADGKGRMLLADVPGEDRYGAGEGERAAVAAEHHAVQLRAWSTRGRGGGGPTCPAAIRAGPSTCSGRSRRCGRPPCTRCSSPPSSRPSTRTTRTTCRPRRRERRRWPDPRPGAPGSTAPRRRCHRPRRPGPARSPAPVGSRTGSTGTRT